MTDADVLISAVDGAIATITLNRPERLNALNGGLLDALVERLELIAADDTIRVLVLTGAGRAFSAGGDLQQITGRQDGPPADPSGPAVSPAEDFKVRIRRWGRVAELLRDMPQVSIAAVNGPCAGAGLSIACACDLRYTAASALFTTAFLLVGLPGDLGGHWTLSRVVGPAKARELFLLADKVSAAEAERIGLVTAVVADTDLLPHVQAVAARLAGFAPLTLRAVKADQNDALTLGLSDYLDVEADRQSTCRFSEDGREAGLAFLQKRAPVFHGR